MGSNYNRRSFLSLAGKGAGLLGMLPLALKANKPLILKKDKDFWEIIREQYELPDNFINLNNAGVSPHPTPVLDEFMKLHKYSNQAPSFFMWRKVDKKRDEVRKQLAEMLGGKPSEIAITRNATESLNTIIQGFPLKKKDEVVIGNYDYPHMNHAFDQRAALEGIVVKRAQLQLPSEDKVAIIKAYVDQFSKRTKLVHITHLVNWCGQVLPVKEIAEEAHKRGIPVAVDAAQSFGHLDFNIQDWKIDFLGTSLHKWLGAPFGTGFLWIKEEHIPSITVPFPGEDPADGKITKFEHVGTRNHAAEMTILKAIEFHNQIGSKQKQERLYSLKQYWTEKASKTKSIKIHTPASAEFSGVVAVVSIDGKEPKDISRILWKDYKIHTTVMKYNEIHGVRVSPNVYTRLSELDKLVSALEDISKS